MTDQEKIAELEAKCRQHLAGAIALGSILLIEVSVAGVAIVTKNWGLASMLTVIPMLVTPVFTAIDSYLKQKSPQ